MVIFLSWILYKHPGSATLVSKQKVNYKTVGAKLKRVLSNIFTKIPSRILKVLQSALRLHINYKFIDCLYGAIRNDFEAGNIHYESH
jgi:hypothetical protein